MSDYAEVIILVEGQTEEIFVKKLLVPYFSPKNIFLTPIILSKKGQKGGDIKFSRAIKDIRIHLKQRNDTHISFLIDYYGTKEWPGLEDAKHCSVPEQIASIINNATINKIKETFSDVNIDKRIIPHIAVHEFETYLYSDLKILSKHLEVNKKTLKNEIKDFNSIEEINNSYETAPSKRLEKLYNRFKKTTTGITIAEDIGIDKIRKECPLFDKWLHTIEELV